MKYLRMGTFPSKIPEGRFLMHNHVRSWNVSEKPEKQYRSQGESGFRAWTEDHIPDGFELCDCGWSGLEHYSRYHLMKE